MTIVLGLVCIQVSICSLWQTHFTAVRTCILLEGPLSVYIGES